MIALSGGPPKFLFKRSNFLPGILAGRVKLGWHFLGLGNSDDGDCLACGKLDDPDVHRICDCPIMWRSDWLASNCSHRSPVLSGLWNKKKTNQHKNVRGLLLSYYLIFKCSLQICNELSNVPRIPSKGKRPKLTFLLGCQNLKNSQQKP